MTPTKSCKVGFMYINNPESDKGVFLIPVANNNSGIDVTAPDKGNKKYFDEDRCPIAPIL